MRRLTAGAALIIGAALGTACSLQTDGAAAAQNEYLVRALMSAVERADTSLIVDLFWPDATYDDFPSQEQYRGIGEIVGYVTSAHSWGDDVYVNVGRVHVGAAGAVAEWVFAAVQNRPMGDLVPVVTGQEVMLSGVTIIEVEGGRIVRAADYTDTAPMALQLGGRIEFPGGTVLELDIGN